MAPRPSAKTRAERAPATRTRCPVDTQGTASGSRSRTRWTPRLTRWAKSGSSERRRPSGGPRLATVRPGACPEPAAASSQVAGVCAVEYDGENGAANLDAGDRFASCSRQTRRRGQHSDAVPLSDGRHRDDTTGVVRWDG